MVDYPSMQTEARPRTQVINQFMRGIYGWMGLGLAITAVLAWAMVSVPAVGQLVFQYNAAGQIVGVSPIVFALMIGELVLVFWLMMRVQKMSPTKATTIFLAYAALNGITLSPIVLAYTAESIASTFFVTAGMFGAMSAYGLLTKKDLTGMGSFLMMGLIGLLIAMVVNMFLRSSQMGFIISCLGVLIFAGLTAYDTQKFKAMGEVMPDNPAAIRRGSIIGALQLYLDFINLFLMLLRLMGDRR